jgi:hypothetical protein
MWAHGLYEAGQVPENLPNLAVWSGSGMSDITRSHGLPGGEAGVHMNG